MPLFLSQIWQGGPVTVTDPKATRYFLSWMKQLILSLRLPLQLPRGIFIPTVTEPLNILNMALEMIKEVEIRKSSRD